MCQCPMSPAPSCGCPSDPACPVALTLRGLPAALLGGQVCEGPRLRPASSVSPLLRSSTTASRDAVCGRRSAPPVPGREASGCVLRPRRFSTGNPRPLVRAAVSVPSLPDQTSPRPAVPEVWFRCVSDGWAGPARGRGPPEPAGFRVSPGSQVLGQSRGSRRCSRHRVRPAEAGSRALPCPVGRRSSSVRPPRRAAAPCVFYSGRHVFPAPGFSFLRHYS